MDIHAYKYFADTYRLESMALAARENHVTSPAISLAITRLEATLGQSLIVHRRRGLEFTKFGHDVAREAAAMLEVLNNFQNNVIAKGSSKKFGISHARIGIARMLATYKFDDVLCKIKEFDPDLKVSLDLADSKQILDRLEDRKLDLGLLISDERRPSLSDVTLYSGYFCMVKPRTGHNKRVSYGVTEPRPEVHSAKTLYRKTHKSELPVFAEVASWDTIWNWVNKGLCGGVIPDLLLKRKTETRTNFTVENEKLHRFEVRLYFRKSMANHGLTLFMRENLSADFKLP